MFEIINEALTLQDSKGNQMTTKTAPKKTAAPKKAVNKASGKTVADKLKGSKKVSKKK